MYSSIQDDDDILALSEAEKKKVWEKEYEKQGLM